MEGYKQSRTAKHTLSSDPKEQHKPLLSKNIKYLLKCFKFNLEYCSGIKKKFVNKLLLLRVVKNALINVSEEASVQQISVEAIVYKVFFTFGKGQK